MTAVRRGGGSSRNGGGVRGGCVGAVVGFGDVEAIGVGGVEAIGVGGVGCSIPPGIRLRRPNPGVVDVRGVAVDRRRRSVENRTDVVGRHAEGVVVGVLDDALDGGGRVRGARKQGHGLAFGVVAAPGEFADEPGRGLQRHGQPKAQAGQKRAEWATQKVETRRR